MTRKPSPDKFAATICGYSGDNYSVKLKNDKVIYKKQRRLV